jgi:hypothetical protein
MKYLNIIKKSVIKYKWALAWAAAFFIATDPVLKFASFLFMINSYYEADIKELSDRIEKLEEKVSQ